MLELQVLQQGLGQRVDLLAGGLDECDEPAHSRRDDVRDAADLPQGVGDGTGAVLGVRAVLLELAAHGLGTGLSHAHLGDLGLGLGELQQSAQLLDGLRGVLVCHADSMPRRSGR